MRCKRKNHLFLTPGMELRERDFRVAQPREIPKVICAFESFQKAGLVLPRHYAKTNLTISYGSSTVLVLENKHCYSFKIKGCSMF